MSETNPDLADPRADIVLDILERWFLEREEGRAPDLDALCGGDAALSHRVRSLIANEPTLLGLDAGEMALSAPALGRAGDAEADLGPIVAFLCSTGSHFLTGATLSADGGVWMGT